MVTLTFILAAILALAHVFGRQLRFLQVIPRSRWLSAAGGISVAYVFIHIFPALSRAQEVVHYFAGPALGFLEQHAYILALLGLAVFYGLEQAARLSRRSSRETGRGDVTKPGVFWLHMASFSIYNALIGYLLIHREQPGIRSLLLFALAMAVHFVVNDYGLRAEHKGAYDRFGRWILAVAVLVGWAVGWAVALHPALVGILFAFIAGAVILNVLKEELPEERESSFWAFALGAVAYTVVLLAS